MGAGEDEHERERRRLIITLAAAAAVARAARAITVCRQHGASLLALVQVQGVLSEQWKI